MGRWKPLLVTDRAEMIIAVPGELFCFSLIYWRPTYVSFPETHPGYTEGLEMIRELELGAGFVMSWHFSQSL